MITATAFVLIIQKIHREEFGFLKLSLMEYSCQWCKFEFNHYIGIIIWNGEMGKFKFNFLINYEKFPNFCYATTEIDVNETVEKILENYLYNV